MRPLLSLALLTLLPAAAAGQDVEMLGERYGTPVPRSYYEIRGGDPGAFEFTRGRTLRMRARMEALARAGTGGVARVLGPKDGPVTGTVRIPVLMGLFVDSPDSVRYGSDTLQVHYFGEDGATIRAYYAEVSGGRVAMEGDVRGWIRATGEHTRAWVTNGSSGLQGRTGMFIKNLLESTEGVDWGLFDNDGADGLPNSGDDDGFVDALAVIQPTPGAECGGPERDDRIWSHRWSLRSATGQPFMTTTPAAGGGVIRVDDYIIQPVFACNGSDVAEIGVFTHELGHAFGLPDLYDTDSGDGRHQGAGNWELMASGSWGCDNHSPARPCHMGAWSKAMLGWADVIDVPAGSDLIDVTLPPVETSGTVYRVESSDDSGEYFLLENRQRLGFDASVRGEGLLVWQIDADYVAATWPVNSVNAHEHMGVWLRQADGFNQLNFDGGNRGDAGDPFPYDGANGENNAFHAGSRPASVSFEESATGVTLVDITRAGNDVTFGVMNRLLQVSMATEGAEGPGSIFTVNGSQAPGTAFTFTSAAFVQHTVEVAAGEALRPGVRRPFLAWADDAEAPRVREIVTPMEDLALVARFGGRQVELAIEVTGGINGVDPAVFKSIPYAADLWFAEGAEVSLEVVPRTGFAFLEWTGDLAGHPNPTTLTMDAPVSAGAAFELTYAVAAASAAIEAATDQQIYLAVENGTAPISWRVVEGSLPEGLTFEGLGRIAGAALETGTFSFEVEALDGIGLTARGTVTLDVTDPVIAAARLASTFLLVGEALTPIQRTFLDRRGNTNGVYDLGDLRAWVLAHPDLPLTGPVRALVAPATLMLAPPRGGAR